MMTRLYAKFLPFFLFPLLLLAFAARTLGSGQPTKPALSGFVEGCEAQSQPCWQGIVPKITPVVDAMQILKDARYTEFTSPMRSFRFAYRGPHNIEVYFDSTYGSTVDRLDLIFRDTLPIGDVLSILGQPERVMLAHKRGMVAVSYGNETNWLYIDFMDTRFEALEPFRESHFGVGLFWLKNPRPDDAFRWHGFAPLWRYCQIQPTAKAC